MQRFLRKKLLVILAFILIISAVSPASAIMEKTDLVFDYAEKIEEKVANPDTMTIMLTGDIMCHQTQQHAAYNGSSYDFTPTFKYVKGIFDEADYVVGNLETLAAESLPLSKDNVYVQTRPFLNAPGEFLDALKYAGFDGLILANNHCCDGGRIGIEETLKVLDEKGFQHTGLFDSPEDKRYFIAEANGIKVGILAYATYFNKKEQLLTEEEQEYMLNRTIEQNIKRDVETLGAEGAEYIIAYNHCGTEYSKTPAARQKRYADMFARAGVDYMVGSHPHVLQRFEYKATNSEKFPVIYSMGNFVSSMVSPETKETIILSLTLKKNLDGTVELMEQTYYPCYMLDYHEGESFVLMPESEKYNGGFEFTEEVKNAFDHVRKIVGTKHFNLES